MNITVLTASIPSRYGMLCDAIKSVNEQSVRPARHLISIDYEMQGVENTLDQLAQSVETDWMMVLDDDDLLLEHHIGTIFHASIENRDLDVIYTDVQCLNGNWFGYKAPFSYEGLEHTSIVPITAAVKTEYYHKAKGYISGLAFDWEFWQRVAQAGANFRKIDAITWVYRFHGHNRSREGVGGDGG